MDEFKVGDVVRLKSGSPDMTVEIDVANNYETEGYVRCVWFEGSKKLWADFLPAMLAKSEPQTILMGVV